MKYTFFDVETANFEQSSICSIGYIVLENNIVVEKGYHLVKPIPFYMYWRNTQIHGLTKEMVQNEPTFDVIWEKIKKHFNNTTLVAHFAPFDTKCLKDVLKAYGLDLPNADYTCTCALSRKGARGLPNYKLDTLARHYGIHFSHHNAMEDTEACYKIMMNLLKDNCLDNIEDLHDVLKIRKNFL